MFDYVCIILTKQGDFLSDLVEAVVVEVVVLRAASPAPGAGGRGLRHRHPRKT